MAKHKCGACKELFESEEEYLNHDCPIGKAKPTSPEYLKSTIQKNYDAVSKAALDRGKTQTTK